MTAKEMKIHEGKKKKKGQALEKPAIIASRNKTPYQNKYGK
jgi:hypothetical protein